MAESESPLIASLSDDGVCTITMNRPDKLNSWNAEMERELVSAFATIESEIGRYRVVVLRGAGRAFCAGVDLDVVTEELCTSVVARIPTTSPFLTLVLMVITPSPPRFCSGKPSSLVRFP